MKKEKIEKYIEKEFNNSYNCTIKPEDIIAKTDFFDKKHEEEINFVKPRMNKIKFAILFILVAIVASATTYVIVDRKTNNNQNIGYLTSNERNELIKYDASCSNYPNSYILLNKEISLAIYTSNNTGSDKSTHNVYCYKLFTNKSNEQVIKLYVNGELLEINNSNYLGVLTKIPVNEKQIINIKSTIDGVTKTFSIEF